MAEKQSKKAARGQKQVSRRRVKFPAKQGNCQVGYGNPPEEHQFKPGQSGNLKGPPKHRTQLWTYFCRYMALTDAELAKLNRKKLTQAQQTALKLVENAKKGRYSGSERLARHVFDREEGRPTEHVLLGEEHNVLTDEDCERIREVLRRNFEAASGNEHDLNGGILP